MGGIRSWMESYRRSWEQLDSVTLPALFTTRGVSWANPFAKPVPFCELNNLWNVLAEGQCENFLEFDVVTMRGDRAFVLYHCLTTHPQSRLRREGYGVFELVFVEAACEQQMEWSRWSSYLAEAPHMPVGKLRSVVRYVEDHLGEQLPVPEVAHLSKLSARHASRLFRVFTAQPLHQFIVRHRVTHARERLAWHDEPTAEIGHELGFSSQAHFTTAFKQNTTFTPSQYRERFRAVEKGPVHAWLDSVDKERVANDWPSVARRLGLSRDHSSLSEPELWGDCIDGLSIAIAADTPSTAIVHWTLHGSSQCDLMPVGDGMLLLDFTPEGACRSIESFPHWN